MAETNWQPIETAPTDGTCILVYLAADHIGSRIHVMRTGRAPVISGVFAWDLGRYPTHWMPLPAPPAKEPAR